MTNKREKATIDMDSLLFGKLAIFEENIVSFESGLLGFPLSRRFVVLDTKDDIPFKWLQSVDETSLAFMIMDPLVLKKDYKIILKESEVSDLGKPDPEALSIFSILTIPNNDPALATANLKAPLLVNLATRKGKQIVLYKSSYSLNYPLFSE